MTDTKNMGKFAAVLSEDEGVYAVIDAFQMGTDNPDVISFLETFETVDSNIFETAQAYNEEVSISKKSPAGNW